MHPWRQNMWLGALSLAALVMAAAACAAPAAPQHSMVAAGVPEDRGSGVSTAPAIAVQPPAADGPSEAIPVEPPAVHVTLHGTDVLEVREPIGNLTVVQRGAAIERRLLAAAALGDKGFEAIRIERRAGALDIYAGEQFVISVTPQDAAWHGEPEEMRAAEVARIVGAALRADYANRSTPALLRAVALSIAALGAGILAWICVAFLSRAIERRWRNAVLPDMPADPMFREAARFRSRPSRSSLRSLLVEHLGSMLLATMRVVRLVAGCLLALISSGYAFSLFPWTRGLASVIKRTMGAAIQTALSDVVDYLPNLAHIAVLVVVSRLAINSARLLFARIAAGDLRFRGFHAEWGEPTFQIVRVLLMALTLAAIVPHLPGSDSRALQGVTVLLGVLVSLGSASAIGNLIAGLVITYMRSLAVGDRVRIGADEGDVVGRDAFVVRVRTIKNLEITIPNAAVLSGTVMNFSAGARDVGLVLHTGVTIGYDVPWRQVHALLISAGQRTELVERSPLPFVLQTALDDFYVRYELNIYTKQPGSGARILSELHGHILDVFADAGIEVMSPTYAALRDGTRSTVPVAGSR